jgi:hypothetical protein
MAGATSRQTRMRSSGRPRPRHRNRGEAVARIPSRLTIGRRQGTCRFGTARIVKAVASEMRFPPEGGAADSFEDRRASVEAGVRRDVDPSAGAARPKCTTAERARYCSSGSGGHGRLPVLVPSEHVREFGSGASIWAIPTAHPQPGLIERLRKQECDQQREDRRELVRVHPRWLIHQAPGLPASALVGSHGCR